MLDQSLDIARRGVTDRSSLLPSSSTLPISAALGSIKRDAVHAMSPRSAIQPCQAGFLTRTSFSHRSASSTWSLYVQCLCLAFAACIGSLQSGLHVQAATYTLGGLFPMSGPLEQAGLQCAAGALLALSAIQANLPFNATGISDPNGTTYVLAISCGTVLLHATLTPLWMTPLAVLEDLVCTSRTSPSTCLYWYLTHNLYRSEQCSEQYSS